MAACRNETLIYQIQHTKFDLYATLSNVLTTKQLSRLLLSNYPMQCIKNTNSGGATPSRLVTEWKHYLQNIMFTNHAFSHKDYELSASIHVGLLHILYVS